jgi:DNA polymerase-3 subunit alpha
VGEGAVRPIVEEREEGGVFETIGEFCLRADLRGLNRRALESLIKAGAFDTWGSRRALLEAADQVLSLSQREAHRKQMGQASMFDGRPNGMEAGPVAAIATDGEDVPPGQKVAWEKELLGVPLSSTPLKAIALVNSGGAITSADQLDADMDGQSVKVIGQLSSVSERLTRHQRPYLIATLELLYGGAEVIAWPDALERTREVWQEGSLLLVSGRIKVRGDELSVHCDQATPYVDEHENGTNGIAEIPELQLDAKPIQDRPRRVLISLVESGHNGDDAHLLREAIRTILEYPGTDRVQLEISTNGRRVLMDLPMVTAGYCPELRERIEELLGAGSLKTAELGGEDTG